MSVSIMSAEEKQLLARVAKRIKELRVRKQISQRIMEYDTELNIYRIEAGTRNITIITLKRVCDYFEISLEEFFKEL